MQVSKLNIPDIIVIEPQVFVDDRGFFFESFNSIYFRRITGIETKFVQDNHSKSKKGVLRGLHYQLPPKTQGKLVRVVKGEVFDVAVDIRRDSSTFGQWIGEFLSEYNKKQLWIPPGFAHGFLSMRDDTELLYKTTNFYSKTHERSIVWNDPKINISWPKNSTIFLSIKDKMGSMLQSADLL